MRAFYRTLRTVAIITLFFFSWTYLPIYAAVAWAAGPEVRSADFGVRSEKQKDPVAAGFSLRESEAARFEKALESIREHIGKAEEKTQKGQDITAEVAEVKKQRAEIEAIDVELKKEFAATEKKLKDAKLPQEVLDRHYKFVKHYEGNLKELKVNLAGIAQGAESKGFNAALKKAKDHLERTKPPKKHVPLDPNNLPFQNRKAKAAKAPRLTKEEFEKDFPPQRTQSTQRIAGMHPFDNSAQSLPSNVLVGDTPNSALVMAANVREWSRIKYKPVILAYNDIASDASSSSLGVNLISSFESSRHPLSASALDLFSASESLLLAQTAQDLPTAADLSETPEVQFTPEIRAKAQELGYNPVKIYEWVRNNIEYAPTYGSIQGASQCLQSKICNDMDTASLLIALLRVSGIYAHYVYGTIEIPNDKAMNWVGGVTDPKMAGTIFASTGIPARGHLSGGTIDYHLIEHVWVKAFIDYIPSRGAVQRQGNTWIPLDASFKQYTYTRGIDISSTVSIDAQTFASQLLSTATTNTVDGSVTNVDSAYVQQTMQDYQTQVLNYIQQNYPSATVGDVIGKKEIIQQNYPILLGTLPYKTVHVGIEFATVPDNLRESISFNIPDPTGASAGLTYTTGMPQIAGKKITLSFSPATANDEAVIKSLLPQPNPDGSSINSSQFPQSIPTYLINLEPELRVDGQFVARGSAVAMGSAQSFIVSQISEMGHSINNINNIVKAGEYFAIGIDTGRLEVNSVNAIKTKLDSAKTKLETGSYLDLTKDDIVGEILHGTITSYFAELDAADEVAAQAMNIIRYRLPSVGMFSLSLNTNNAFGIPISASPKGMMIDVDRLMLAAFSKDGNIETVKRYMLSVGVNSSQLEHVVPELIFSTSSNHVQGFSAIKILQHASDQGVPIFLIDRSNINTLLPQIQLNQAVKADVQNAVNAGEMVILQKEDITYNSWTGCGYIIIDPTSGAGAYKISGGSNGGGFEYKFWTFMLQLAWFVLIASLAIIAAVLILLLPEIIAGLSAFSVTVGATVYVTLGHNLFKILMDAVYLCYFSGGVETPPGLPTNVTCGVAFVIAMLTKNAYR